jgi:hypothetical protein
MAKGYSGRTAGGSTVGRRSTSSGSTSQRGSGAVSAARLHQKSGAGNAFGGYTKVNHTNGTFSMKRTGK